MQRKTTHSIQQWSLLHLYSGCMSQKDTWMDGWMQDPLFSLSSYLSIFCIFLHPLFNKDLLPQILCSGVGWSRCARAGQAVGSHILFIGLPDYPKCLHISVWNVRDGVSVKRRLMGNRADLLDRNSRSWGLGKETQERFIITECDVGAGAFGRVYSSCVSG